MDAPAVHPYLATVAVVARFNPVFFTAKEPGHRKFRAKMAKGSKGGQLEGISLSVP